MSDYYLAVDIGASSGRHILGKVEEGIISLEEIHRFSNGMDDVDNHLCWDLNHLKSEIIIGMKKAKELNKIPKTIAIDTWGVDFVLMNEDGKIVGNTVSYRDSRTENMPSELKKLIDDKNLYSKTGIQEQPFNTIYQLMALKKECPEQVKEAKHLVQIPDYLSYELTGNIINEYTNATTTNLVNVNNKSWNWDLIDLIDIPRSLFQEKLTEPGTEIGPLILSIANEVGYSCNVITAASHDTASAFVAVPAKDECSVYISSGTWSLLGVENTKPITTDESLIANFTNEGGYNNTIRYLKNIMGLWMIQSCKKNWGSIDSYDALEKKAKNADINKTSIINVNDDVFLSPLSMVTAIKDYCSDNDLVVPRTKGEVMLTVYRSLAKNYKESIDELSLITNKQYSSINIVGGGSSDSFLNQLTANETDLTVYAGPTEGTALGNLIIQFISDGIIEDIPTARKYIRNSFEIKEYMNNRS